MDDILMETELNMQSAIENMEKRLLNIWLIIMVL